MFYPEQTIAEIVAADYRAAGVFKKYGLDFCCGGRKPVSEAAEKHGIDSDILMEDLNQATSSPADNQIDFSQWSPELLITYIEQMHHKYVTDAIPRIGMFTEKVALRHGDTMPELITIYQKFMELSVEMRDHMLDEEQRVFPTIKKFIQNSEESLNLIPMITELEDEHTAAGNLMAELRELTSGFNPPEWACNTFRVAYAELEAFESDLHRHVHLENNILFPKVAKILSRINAN
mgnify:CR=1 FL=1